MFQLRIIRSSEESCCQINLWNLSVQYPTVSRRIPQNLVKTGKRNATNVHVVQRKEATSFILVVDNLPIDETLLLSPRLSQSSWTFLFQHSSLFCQSVTVKSQSYLWPRRFSMGIYRTCLATAGQIIAPKQSLAWFREISELKRAGENPGLRPTITACVSRSAVKKGIWGLRLCFQCPIQAGGKVFLVEPKLSNIPHLQQFEQIGTMWCLCYWTLRSTL